MFIPRGTAIVGSIDGLRDFPKLRVLVLGRPKNSKGVMDGSLANLRNLTDLEELEISGQSCSFDPRYGQVGR